MASSPDSGPEANFEMDLDEMDREMEREMEREETHGWVPPPSPPLQVRRGRGPVGRGAHPRMVPAARVRALAAGAEVLEGEGEGARCGGARQDGSPPPPAPLPPPSPYPSQQPLRPPQPPAQSSPHHPTPSTTTSSPGAGRRRPSTNSPSPGQSWVERRRAKRREAEMEGREVVREAEQPRQHLERKEQARKGVEVKRTKERSEKESVVQAKRRRCALLEVEAEVSGEEGSGDEVEEAEEQSFVDEPQGGGRAMYLRSLRSTPPRPARPLPPLTAEVFSQEPLLDDSYLEDSFCVSDGEEVEEEGEDNLDILERRADHLSFGKGRIAVRPSEE